LNPLSEQEIKKAQHAIVEATEPQRMNGGHRSESQSESDPKGPESQRLTDLVEAFRQWLYLPDPGALITVLATAVANRLLGDPVWLLIVGPPGCGKTELLQPLAGLPEFHQVATLTEASLLSGTPKRERSDGAHGGLLRTIGQSGTILLKDFGSILSMQREARSAVLAALREVFDGAWTRHLGTDGGKTLAWTGKAGLIAGCTPAVDSHHAVMASLGERFLLYRLPAADADELADAALAHVGSERTMRAELTRAVTLWFEGISMPAAPITVEGDDRKFLIDLSTLVVRCRSAIERDYHNREIEFVPEAEAPGRFARTLAQLVAGMTVSGVTPGERRRLTRKVGLDCIPALRRRAVESLAANAGTNSTADIAGALDHPISTVRRALEDLAAHRVIVRHSQGPGKSDFWELNGWTRERWEAVR